MTEINASITAISELVSGIAEFMASMEQSAQRSGGNSEAVAARMEELSQLSGLLNQTVASFRV